MSARAGTPEPRLFFLSRGGADADVALAVARILQEAGQRTILQDEDLTHQDFMAAMERAFAAGDQSAVTVVFLSADHQASHECQAQLGRALVDGPDAVSARVVMFRIGEATASGPGAALGYVDLVPVLAIEDDARRGQVFTQTILGALGVSGSCEHRVYLRDAAGAAATPEGRAALALRGQSGRADIALGAFAHLAKVLGNEPLALRLAARLLAERPGATIGAYLEALSEHGAPAPERTSYPPVLRAALLISFEVVESDPAMQGHSATSLLALSAFMPSGHVPSRAFRERPDAYPPELVPFAANAGLRESALGLLERLSLVTRSGPAHAYSVEPHCQAVLRDLLAESGRADEWSAVAARFAGDGAGVHDPADAIAEMDVSPAGSPSANSRDLAFAAFERGEALTADGKPGEALAAFETARAIFQGLMDRDPEDTQAQADLAASQAKIGFTHIGAGQTREGDVWLKSCRELIARLARREPGNEHWPRYLESLDTQLAEIGRANVPPPPMPRKPAAAPPAPGGDTVRRLVNALKEPAPDPLEPPTEALNAEEPPPLVIEADRTPPKVFSDADGEPVALEPAAVIVKSKRRILPLAVNGHGHDAPNGDGPSSPDALGPAIDPLVPPRKAGFLKRLLGRSEA